MGNHNSSNAIRIETGNLISTNSILKDATDTLSPQAELRKTLDIKASSMPLERKPLDQGSRMDSSLSDREIRYQLKKNNCNYKLIQPANGEVAHGKPPIPRPRNNKIKQLK